MTKMEQVTLDADDELLSHWRPGFKFAVFVVVGAGDSVLCLKNLEIMAKVEKGEKVEKKEKL